MIDINSPQAVIELILQVIGVLSVIATVTPTPVDNVVLVALRKVLNLLAMNWAQSENKKKPGDKNG